MASSFTEFLSNNEVVLDGGFATLLETHGHDLKDSLWSSRLLRDDPAAITAAHKEFFDSGADVAITSSYHASFEGFAKKGFTDAQTEELLKLSVKLARDAQPKDRQTFVAASVGPWGVVLANGSEYNGDYMGAEDERIRKEQARRIKTLSEAKPDLIAVETIPNANEARILGEILQDVEIPTYVSFACRDGHAISDGTPLVDVIKSLTAGKPKALVAVGINCTPPQHVSSLLADARSVTDLPLLVYPNWGRVWDGDRYEWHGAGVEGFSSTLLEDWKSKGARVIGGCCGIGCDAIKDIRKWVDTN